MLDLAGLAAAGLIDGLGGAFAAPVLNPFMAAGPAAWAAVREALGALRGDPRADAHRHPLGDVALHLPFAVADYADFYASEHHATNLGRILRPGDEPLLPNWRRLPVGYHGRAGTVVVSGTDVVRPCGQYLRGGRRARVRPEPPARHRARARLRRRGPERARGARAGRAGARARLRRRAAQRLERARPAGLGVPAARAVPRQVVRHVGLRVGDAAGRAAPRGTGRRRSRRRCPTWRRRRGRSTSRSRSSSTASGSPRPTRASSTGARRR